MKNCFTSMVLGVVSLAVPALATPILSFTTGNALNDSAAITFNSATNMITGTGIGFTSLVVTNDGANNSTWVLAGSAAASSGGTAAAFGFTYNTVTHQGTFSIVGSATRGGTTVAALGSTLASGTITAGVLNQGGGTSTNFNLAFNAGTGLANDLVESNLAIPTNQAYTITGSEIGSSASPGGYPYNATSSSLTLTAVAPEPGTILLFGSGLIALGVFARRSPRKK